MCADQRLAPGTKIEGRDATIREFEGTIWVRLLKLSSDQHIFLISTLESE